MKQSIAMFWFLCFVIIAVHLIAASVSSENEMRPVIALVGQEMTTKSILKKYPELKGRAYVAASYVKFIEAAGAEVLPITEPVNSSDIYDIFFNTNGVVFPGGHEDVMHSEYEKTTKAFMYFIQNSSKVADEYPMLGICLGMEEMATLVANKAILTETNAHNIGLPMKFTSEVKTSRFFKDMPSNVKTALTSTKAAFNSHTQGLSPRAFDKHSNLRNLFNIISTSRDKDGVEFVAAMEAKNYPIVGIQWHPEKTRFIWNLNLTIDHSRDAVYASQFIANRFVDLASENKHRFPSSWNNRLIYHYKPWYTGDISIYEEIYVL